MMVSHGSTNFIEGLKPTQSGVRRECIEIGEREQVPRTSLEWQNKPKPRLGLRGLACYLRRGAYWLRAWSIMALEIAWCSAAISGAASARQGVTVSRLASQRA
jgi:hypothetical protein